jgi:hypothetical protein
MSGTESIARALTAHEGGFLDLESPNRIQVVSGVAILDGALEFDRLSERLEVVVAEKTQYRCLITGTDERTWQIDPEFDLARHCYKVELSGASTNDVLTWTANQAARGLDPRHSPWRIILIEGVVNEVNGQVGSAVAILAHHALIDGLEGLNLYSSLLDPSPPKSAARSEANPNPNRRSHAVEKGPVVSSGCVKAMMGEMTRRAARSPLTGEGSSGRQAISFTWTREQFNRAKDQLNASFQEVLLSILSEGLSGYCRRHGQIKNLRAILPLGRQGGKTPEFDSNRHDAGFLSMPLRASDISQRIEKIRAGLNHLKIQRDTNVFPTIINFVGRLPGRLRQRFVTMYASRAALLISILPGGKRKQQISGITVRSLFAQPALPPRHAVTIGAIAMRNQVCVTVQLDPAVVKSPQDLASELNRAFETFSAAVA